ncbi:dihydrofolate reductase family protein [Rhodococcus sp. Z13]|uniref:Dihydrofolate reductase family protein n=1 Tax=Rhodococcus sacchari TaxID=2962047 RepID=A0ACD4DDT3_9NOCA|nr:dihydrofolate reductase family protein [Rhodococcus sp. Z13]UYP18189.1 dihydrofolate reductase family protein [Rhodococcus sp. Z13]
MTRMIYYTASTLDGFLATEDHSLDWLLTRDTGEEGGPADYESFIAGVGAMVMGASTYRWVLDHAGEGAWEYELPCWVFTHRDDLPVARRGSEPGDIRFTRADVREVYAEMAETAGGRDLWMVGGGDLAGQFADHGLLDELIVSFAPVTIGAGKPLLPRHVELRPVELARSGEFAVARYEVLKENPARL